MPHDSPMDSPAPNAWRTLPALDAPVLEATRLTLHHAAQLLAVFGQALVEPREDDSHRAMTWDADQEALRGGAADDGLHARLTVPDLTLEVLRDGARVGGLGLQGQSLDEALRWLGGVVGQTRGEAPALAWPEYDLPDLPGGRGRALATDATALETLAAWYGNAASLLEPLAAASPEASPVRCWPHHFDLATLLTFPATDPKGDARHVGIGFSPGDASIGAPYYYVSGWPPPDPKDLPPLAGAGSWNIQGWVGAVLTADAIVAVGAPAEQRALVDGFLTEAVAAMRSVVLHEG